MYGKKIELFYWLFSFARLLYGTLSTAPGGTNFHKALTHWLDRLERLPDLMDAFKLDFPVRLGFKAMETKESGVVLGKELTFAELASFLYTDLYKGMAAGNVPRRCHNCGHFFLTVGGYDTIYCSRGAPGKTKRTCRQVGAHRKEKQKNEEPIHKEYAKACNRLKARKNRGSLRTDKWNQQVKMIQDWRDAAVRGEISDAELKRRLTSYREFGGLSLYEMGGSEEYLFLHMG